jgi:hypothetical protein
MWSFTFQIDWKQRFFVPSDETSGLDILTSLLDRYPVLAPDEAESEIQSDAPNTVLESGIARANIVDLEEWFVAIEKGVVANETANHTSPQLYAEEPSTQAVAAEEGSAETAIFSFGQEVASMPWL